MIDRHYLLSCYAVQFPFRAYYSKSSETIELIDINHDIYKFRLPDCQNYQKLAANSAIKGYHRFYQTVLIHYQTNQFFVQKIGSQALIVQNGINLGLFVSEHCVIFFISKDPQLSKNTKAIKSIMFTFQQNKQKYQIHQKDWILEYNQSHHQHHKYANNYLIDFSTIKHIFGQYCLLKQFKQKYTLIKLINLHKLGSFKQESIRYQIRHCELPEDIEIVSHFKNTIILKSKCIQQSFQNQIKQFYFFDPEQGQSVALKQLNANITSLQYFTFQNIIITLDRKHFFLFSITNGTLLMKISITNIIQYFQVGSSIILGQQQKQQRFCMLFDRLSLNITEFYLMDKQKLSIYHINAKVFIENSLILPLKAKITQITTDNEYIHQNVMKTLNFRFKKLKTLQQYIDQGLKVLSFGNVLRFLQNEQNIFVMSDGLYMFFNALQANFQRLTKQKQASKQLQRQIIKICSKLITESKYEDHIFKGLTIANNMFHNFRNKYKTFNSNQNNQVYHNLLQSKRIVRLLKQDKNKQLFELSYQLAISVKGYGYLQQIQKKKK